MINLMIYIILFIFGLTIGSFLNVLIYRLPNNLSILGRSFCPSCKHKISWFDNLPLLSFVFLNGKCRSCHSPISFYYPAVELLTGSLFVLVYTQIGIKNYELGIMEIIGLFYYLFIFSSLITIFFIDLKYGIIPNKIVYSAITVSFLALFFTSEESWLPPPAGGFSLPPSEVFVNYLLSAFGSLIFFLILFIFTRGKGMGFGDVKLSFLMGLFLGFPKIIVAFYIAFLTGAIISLILVLCGKKKFKGTVPFGPFLVFGTILSFFAGDLLIQKIFPFLFP